MPTARRGESRCPPLAVLLVLTMACGGGEGGDRDGGPDADASIPPPSAATVLLMGQEEDGFTHLSSYRQGAWSPFESPPNPWVATGITVLGDGRGMAIAYSVAVQPGYMMWSEQLGWSEPAGIDDQQWGNRTGPVRTATGALFARYFLEDDDRAFVSAFDASTSTWGAPAPTPPLRESLTSTLVLAAASEPFVFAYDPWDNTYAWTRREGETYTEPAELGPTIPNSSVGYVAATARAGRDQLVVGYVTGPNIGGAQLWVYQWAGVDWELLGVTALRPSRFHEPAVMAALPDGRIALAVVGFDEQPQVLILDEPESETPLPRTVGTAKVPTDHGGAAFALAAGAEGALLELVYIDLDTLALMHTRLLDEASWTWSAPAVIDDERPWKSVRIASGP